MYSITVTSQFKKDLKRVKKRSEIDFELMRSFVSELQQTGFAGISSRHRPHYLKGNYRDNCECHVLPDLLLIWIEHIDTMDIVLIRCGSHSDLF